MAFLNNWLEMRGDALKIVKHNRRPLPFRSDTIGPWVEVLVGLIRLVSCNHQSTMCRDSLPGWLLCRIRHLYISLNLQRFRANRALRRA